MCCYLLYYIIMLFVGLKCFMEIKFSNQFLYVHDKYCSLHSSCVPKNVLLALYKLNNFQNFG